ncbi:unnamed protein product [Bursaphelenchus xylophilus]|uniref:(pine wood nematode) hypothetical protein n=1 Tax=Bursaphelenchus xylophilus TaxID=6326 RepID=A0A7I8WR16_BURXY|nr:unnamed protein product [Bursaphelenchus xylophilus]CAG9097622.1 unnamed protein product [Bursaphelenchus xylophilus]
MEMASGDSRGREGGLGWLRDRFPKGSTDRKFPFAKSQTKHPKGKQAKTSNVSVFSFNLESTPSNKAVRAGRLGLQMRSPLSKFILFSAISGLCAQYYVVNYPEQQQYYYQQQNYQQLYRPQPAYQQQLVQQPQFQQQVYQQPSQQVYQPVAQPQPPPVQYIPQQQYQQLPPPPSQQYQQAQPQPVQQYQQPQPTTYQQIPQAAPQPVRPQPQRPQVSNVQEKITPPELEKAVKVVSANTYEFDLPPPPPSRFLPDEERAKILQNTKQVDQAKQTRPKRPQHRIVATSEGRTHRTGHQEQHRPASTTSTPAPTTTTATLTTTVASEVNDHVSHLSPTKKNPNKYFLQCCKEKKVAKSCESRCNFDNINKKILTAMFLGSDPCPQRYGLDLFACAAQDSDHTPCCRIKNVQRTSAGEKCLAFCNLRPDSHFQADASYLPCWAVLNDVKTCFKDAIISGEIIQ